MLTEHCRLNIKKKEALRLAKSKKIGKHYSHTETLVVTRYLKPLGSPKTRQHKGYNYCKHPFN